MRVGIHSSTKGNTEANRAVANALGAEVFVWMADCHRPEDAAEWPDAVHIVRLPNPRREPMEAVSDYANRVHQVMYDWYYNPPSRATGQQAYDLWFQIGNEPDIEGYDLSPAWGVDLWKQVAGQYLAYLRHNFPDAKFLSTPFSVANNQHTSKEYVTPFDGVAAHLYWPAEQGYPGPLTQTLSDTYFFTELNSNPTDPHQIAGFLQDWRGPLSGAAIFLADAPPDFAHYDLSPLDAGVIRALLAEPPAPPLPPPFPPPVAGVVGRDAYRFHDLSWPDFNKIILNGSLLAGSPLRNSEAYNSLIVVCHMADIDPRWFLAIVQSETNFGTNPNAAVVPNNFAGIKWVEQAGAYNSGVPYPTAEGAGTYAGFTDMDAFWRELVRIMHNAILGPPFDAGDLLAVAVHYTGGDWGRVKVDIWREMVATYPPSGSVTLEKIHAIATAQIGKTLTLEGNPEFGMCEQNVEEVLELAGLPRTRFYSAAIHGDSLVGEGVLRTGEWPRGAVLVWGRAFDPNGHICIGDTFPNVITTYPGKITLLSTETAGWYPHPGFLGWYVPAGATEGEDDMALPTDGKADDGIHKDAWLRSGIPLNEGSGFYQKWLALVRAGVPIGIPFSQETPASDGRTIQHFTSGATMTYVDGHVYVN